MNVDNTACASSGRATAWDQIGWPQSRASGQEAASAYRQRPLREGRWGQGESLAMAVDLLVFLAKPWP